MQCLQWHEGRRAAEAEPGLGFNPAELLEVSQASRGFGAVAQAVIVLVCAAFSSGPGRGMQKKENADSIKRRALSQLSSCTYHLDCFHIPNLFHTFLLLQPCFLETMLESCVTWHCAVGQWAVVLLLVELHGSGLTVEHLEHLDIERPSVAYSLVR